jgi:hypothetical protein
MLRVAECAGRRPHEWRVPHGLRDIARTSAIAAAAAGYCYPLLFGGRTSRQTRAKWALV